MRFDQLELQGAYLVSPELHVDERGFFARTACVEQFTKRGLVGEFTQSSVSHNTRRGTVRGMHFSAEPHAETKLVRCTRGAIYDVIVDLRRDSITYLCSFAVELNSENHLAVYIPVGFAHGFQTLRDFSEVLYMIDQPHVPSSAKGLRWNDPSLNLSWPEPVSIISRRDASFEDWAIN